jgi:formiminotetrahydrofolate cyclodeaminase
MNKYIKKSVDEFLESLAGKSITPGGGAAAALSASLAAALNLMVINYSFSLSELKGSKKYLKDAFSRQKEAFESLKKLIDEDSIAFTKLMKTLSAKRDAQDEYIAAASVPMKVCVGCVKTMNITRQLVGRSNPNLSSDLDSAANIAMGAFLAAKLNVEINFKYVKNKVFSGNVRKSLKDMHNEIDREYRFITKGQNKWRA